MVKSVRLCGILRDIVISGAGVTGGRVAGFRCVAVVVIVVVILFSRLYYISRGCIYFIIIFISVVLEFNLIHHCSVFKVKLCFYLKRRGFINICVVKSGFESLVFPDIRFGACLAG